jgi:hypothetical protein
VGGSSTPREKKATGSQPRGIKTHPYRYHSGHADYQSPHLSTPKTCKGDFDCTFLVVTVKVKNQ